MYVGVGTSETPDLKPSAEIVNSVEQLEKVLRSKGLGPARLKVVVAERNPQQGAWSRRLPEALMFLYGK